MNIVGSWLESILSPAERPMEWNALSLHSGLTAAVLAPHPDDFDAIAISMRRLQSRGIEVILAVLTSGWKGVEDRFCDPPEKWKKAQVREEEQTESCRLFGLPEASLAFLRLEEDPEGEIVEGGLNEKSLADFLSSHSPDIIFLPHGNDTNATHRRVYRMAQRILPAQQHAAVAFLNRDPKTIGMRTDLYLPFDEKEASWKGELLRVHRSQQERNLITRHHGFDERILAVNRVAASELGLNAPYAEVFELEPMGFGSLGRGLSGC